MGELDEPPARGWCIDLNDPPKGPSEEASAALARASDEVGMLFDRPPRQGRWEGAASAVRSAARLGAGEHELAVATGLTLERVRSLLRGA
jgi:hypothetical protein